MRHALSTLKMATVSSTTASSIGCPAVTDMKKHGSYYCNKTTHAMNRFNSAGQQFLTDIKRCLMEPLLEIYSRDSIDCHDLEDEAAAAMAPCFNEYNFCSVLQTNADEFFRIYDIRDLFTRGARKIRLAILLTAVQCGIQYVREFSSEAFETLLISLLSLGSRNISGNPIGEIEE